MFQVLNRARFHGSLRNLIPHNSVPSPSYAKALGLSQRHCKRCVHLWKHSSAAHIQPKIPLHSPFWKEPCHRLQSYWTSFRRIHSQTCVLCAKVDGGKLTTEERREQIRQRKEAKQKLALEKQKKAPKKVCDAVSYEGRTLPGEKKDVSIPLPSAYSSRFVEAAWNDWWEKEGFFSPDFQLDVSRTDRPFVICLPPPNITGSLHLGHALGNSIQDAICRWHRMHGRSVLWNPGCDHAGIATQVAVEKQIWKERKLTRHDIGREEFIKEVWKWKDEKGGRIFEQMRKLGSSLDWSRACFTLDPKLSRAVTEAFIRLHDEGIIYRNERLVNWSCTLKSAISDIEVDNIDVEGPTKLTVPGYESKVTFGQLVTFAYPVHDSGEKVHVATTRLETMLGDTGVAVHPEDERYSHLHGRFVVHPFTKKKLPIVCDEYVQRDFGTGAVKVTPAHDHNDYAIGLRHNLDSINILDDSGNLINVPEPFNGVPRFKARGMVLKSLKEKGLYVETASHPMTVPVCSRSGDIIEPRLKPQWYVECDEMAQHAIQVVKSGELQLIPKDYEKQWFDWLENIRDWCISRQLWWGHRIPAYRVTIIDQDVTSSDEIWFSGHNIEEATEKACQKLGLPKEKLILHQDEDVLDTWFSSALFPFSIFGWPEETEDLSRFHPTSLLETASDIMFFWVARMVMMGHKLTHQLPFSQVLLHSVLRDSHGRKMSKSLGNIIDPMDVIYGTTLETLNERLKQSNLDPKEVVLALKGQQKAFPQGIPECGADALRFSLCSCNHKANYVNVDINRIHYHWKFCNKIWQAFRYVTSYLDHDFTPCSNFCLTGNESPTDLWMLSCLAQLVQSCDQAFKSYDLNHVTEALLKFWWTEFCDIYIEYSKTVLRSGDEDQVNSVRNILYGCVDSGLRALSPFMPYLTEELYQRLPKPADCNIPSVCVAPYPRTEEFAQMMNPALHEEISSVKRVCGLALGLRKDLNLTKDRADVFIRTTSTASKDAIRKHEEVFRVLSRSQGIMYLGDDDAVPGGCIDAHGENGECVYMHVADLINVQEELSRLENVKQRQESSLEKLQKKLQKITSEVGAFSVEAEKVKELKQSLSSTEQIIGSLRKLL